MILIILIIIILLCIFSVIARLIILHPIATPKFVVKDLFFWLIHKGWNDLEAGKLNAYIAEFGGGKTLSIVHEVVKKYNRFNNKEIWDRGRHKFVLQKIHVISNVDLKTIPYEPLSSLSQVVQCAYHNHNIDTLNDTKTVVLVVLDEASVQLNSRSFKTNIDPLFLNTLLTSRHYHISIFYSTQKFNLTDKLLRDVTQRVIECKKVWRFMVHNIYRADDIEYASDPTMVKPIIRTGFFIFDSDYAAYDTLACVDNLKKSVDNNDMLSQEEIMQLRGDLNPDNEAVTRRSHQLKKRQRHK